MSDDEPPVDRSNWLHHALVVLHAAARMPSALVLSALLTVAAGVGVLWRAGTSSPAAWAAAAVCLFWSVVDWVWLASLPRREVSFGPVQPPLLGLSLLRGSLSLLVLLGYRLGLSSVVCVALNGGLQAVGWCLVVYATRIEPFRLGVTHIALTTPKLPAGRRVRLVQLSDLHVERLTLRERQIVERVKALDADYVLLTGDYLSFSYVGEPRAVADARQVLGSLWAKEGIYAVRGTHQVDPNAVMSELLAGLPIRWLRGEHAVVGRDGYQLTLAGASCTRRPEIDAPAVGRALDGVSPDSYTVLLYHTPELVAEAAARGVDLYLAGHTHGGQLRVPVYGALITASHTGKRYEMGRYQVQDLTLYVSRGLGMEGMAAPRARFLCPPEIVCIDLQGSGSITAG